ncbi:hypothetical protein G7068_07585 [Leucobacter viscericola]|uniref:Uncharacterized protein n=1 Tax=Leucobacter viscericola TaxID=2714935 RepID=A0A6G7XEQ3_9MICO|nr:hypothetical protein [Leucobacter viscericola]QIK63074.1 hypothetical protein G7068_07585 [Leucobacter viscericola]
MTSFTKNSAAANLTEEMIDAFAARVRLALGDLPKGDVVDLTEGLETSLAEQAADLGPGATLPHEGDAVAYANELREAAGLPAGGADLTAEKRPGLFSVVAERLREMRSELSDRIRANPVSSAIFDFFVALQPVWWVLRAWVACLVFSAVFMSGTLTYYYPIPEGVKAWLMLLVASVVSVQWGRGKWMPWRWMRVVRSLGSAFLFVVVLLAAPTVVPQWGTSSYVADTPENAPGMWVNGSLVNNIFAYDANGKPLSEVQLFDQDGRAIVTVGDPEAGTEAGQWVPASVGASWLMPRTTIEGKIAWNVFPLRTVPDAEIDYSEDPIGVVDQTKAMPQSPPSIQVYPLAPLKDQSEVESKPAS